MKTLFLLTLLSLGIEAAPLSFSYEGAYSPIDDGIFVNLQNFNDPTRDRTVTITASEPLTEFRAHFDNRPFHVGSGFVVYLDDVLVSNTGLGGLVDTTLTFSAVAAFTRIRIETNWMPAWLERGTITALTGTEADPRSTVPMTHNPEPSTIFLAIPALLFCLWKARRRTVTTAGG